MSLEPALNSNTSWVCPLSIQPSTQEQPSCYGFRCLFPVGCHSALEPLSLALSNTDKCNQNPQTGTYPASLRFSGLISTWYQINWIDSIVSNSNLVGIAGVAKKIHICVNRISSAQNHSRLGLKRSLQKFQSKLNEFQPFWNVLN